MIIPGEDHVDLYGQTNIIPREEQETLFAKNLK